MQKVYKITLVDTEQKRFYKFDHSGKSLSVGDSEQADVPVATMKGSVFFLLPDGDKLNLVEQRTSSSRTATYTFTLGVGDVLQIGQWHWLMEKSEGERDVVSDTVQIDWQPLFNWVREPMQNVGQLRKGLRDFLEICVNASHATQGILVCNDQEGFTLAECFGVSFEEASDIWQKMPDNLTAEILRQGARVLLPEGLKTKSPQQSTVFVRNVRSIAGFPIMSEGRILAILFLGFKNILLDFTAEIEKFLSSACDLAGLVIGRAELRNETTQLRLSNSFIDQNAMPEGRLMVGYSKSLEQVYLLIGKFAPIDVPVLITGETGTGKELAARELHRLSLRKNKGFVAFNAAALPESLLEAELFGYKRGSFTGAISDRVGLIEQANQGTLFIDEIGDLPPSLQAKLLRVLQEKELTRIGENHPRKVDFRLVSATHFDLNKLVEEKKFRQDLFFRIAAASVVLPPLRERDQDLILIANYIKQQFCKRQGLRNKEWSKEALAVIRHYPWPGNVRELENLVVRSVVMSEGEKILAADLGLEEPRSLVGATMDLGVSSLPLAEAKEIWLKNYLVDALRRNAGNRSETARALQIGQRTLFRYLEQYSIKEFGDERH